MDDKAVDWVDVAAEDGAVEERLAIMAEIETRLAACRQLPDSPIARAVGFQLADLREHIRERGSR